MTHTLWTPPSVGSYQATSLGLVMSETSITCSRPKVRLLPSWSPLYGRPAYTSSPTNTYLPWRHAVCVPRTNPGPHSCETRAETAFRSYLICDRNCGVGGLPRFVPLPPARVTNPSFQCAGYASPST